MGYCSWRFAWWLAALAWCCLAGGTTATNWLFAGANLFIPKEEEEEEAMHHLRFDID